MTKPADSKQAIPSPEDRVRAIREREQKATKGPWVWRESEDFNREPQVWAEHYPNGEFAATEGSKGWSICKTRPKSLTKHSVLWPFPFGEHGWEDGQFIAHARADIPYLLSLVEELKGPWFPIDTAPKDGRHIQAADFRPGQVGFGGNPQQAYQCIVNWFEWGDGTHPEESGFYPSTGAGENPPLTNLTHWKPLEEFFVAAEVRKRKDYHAEYVEAVEAAEKAERELAIEKTMLPKWEGLLDVHERLSESLVRQLEVTREALRKIEDPGAKVDSLMEARMIARAALTPEPATKAEVQK